MELSQKESSLKKKEEDGQAIIQMWKYIFGFTEMAALKCAIDLKIADTIEANGSPMTLSELSSTLNCSPPLLYRILRFLTHRKIFKLAQTTPENPTTRHYAQTPLSRLLVTKGESTMAPLLVLETSPEMLAAWHHLSLHVKNGDSVLPFEAAHGVDLWSYFAANPTLNELFNGAMACCARPIISAMLEGCGGIFEGVGRLVDVGGGNGTTLSILVKACPWMRGINFDLPHVVSSSVECENVEHVAGDMFHFVPIADAVLLKWILHDWNDQECINILKNCKNAIEENTGKVIIIEAVIDEEDEDEMSDVRLMMDLAMMAHTKKGKQRTKEEWAYVINSAGFARFTITSIRAIQSVIQCFP